MMKSNIFRLAVFALMTLLSITAFFRLAILAAIIAGFTGIIIAIAKFKRKPINESTNRKNKANDFVEGNYTIIEETDEKNK